MDYDAVLAQVLALLQEETGKRYCEDIAETLG
jgi:hypothetical protein